MAAHVRGCSELTRSGTRLGSPLAGAGSPCRGGAREAGAAGTAPPLNAASPAPHHSGRFQLGTMSERAPPRPAGVLPSSLSPSLSPSSSPSPRLLRRPRAADRTRHPDRGPRGAAPQTARSTRPASRPHDPRPNGSERLVRTVMVTVTSCQQTRRHRAVHSWPHGRPRSRKLSGSPARGRRPSSPALRVLRSMKLGGTGLGAVPGPTVRRSHAEHASTSVRVLPQSARPSGLSPSLLSVPCQDGSGHSQQHMSEWQEARRCPQWLQEVKPRGQV